MLNPFTITSLSIKVASGAGQLFFELKALRARYKAVPRNLQLFSSQVAALRTATTGVATWLERSVERDENANYGAQQQFEEDLKDVLEGCNLLITLLADHIKGFANTGEPISASSRAKFLWSEQDLDEHRKVLAYQCDALMLILKSFELTSKNQPDKSSQDVAETRRAIAQAKDAACSIISNDTSSNKTEKQSPEFGAPIPQKKSMKDTFDAELDKSGPYAVSRQSIGSSTTAADSSTPLTPLSDTSECSESDALARCHHAETRAARLQEVVGTQQLAIAKLKQEKECLKIVQTYISDCTVLQAQLEEREHSLRLTTEKLEQARKTHDDDKAKLKSTLDRTYENFDREYAALKSKLKERAASEALAVDVAKQQKQEHEKAVAGLFAQLGTKSAQTEKDRAIIDDMTKQIQALRNRLNEFARQEKAAVHQLQVQKSETKAALQTLREELDARNEAESRRQDEKAQTQLHQVVKDFDAKSKVSSEAFQERLRKMQHDHAATLDRFRLVVDKLHKEIDQHRAQKDALRAERDVANARLQWLVEHVSEREAFYTDLIAKSEEEAARATTATLAAATAGHMAVVEEQKRRYQVMNSKQRSLQDKMDLILGPTNQPTHGSVTETAPPKTESQQKPLAPDQQSQPAPQQHAAKQAATVTSSVNVEEKKAKRVTIEAPAKDAKKTGKTWKKRLSTDLKRTTSAPISLRFEVPPDSMPQNFNGMLQPVPGLLSD